MNSHTTFKPLKPLSFCRPLLTHASPLSQVLRWFDLATDPISSRIDYSARAEEQAQQLLQDMCATLQELVHGIAQVSDTVSWLCSLRLHIFQPTRLHSRCGACAEHLALHPEQSTCAHGFRVDGLPRPPQRHRPPRPHLQEEASRCFPSVIALSRGIALGRQAKGPGTSRMSSSGGGAPDTAAARDVLPPSTASATASLLARASCLAAAMDAAGAVRVSRRLALVPREALRSALQQCMERLLEGAASHPEVRGLHLRALSSPKATHAVMLSCDVCYICSV